ncbi:MAG: radical SAM protein [Gammaproteobacteria bacterium]|nr:radical SAM protein [Gammaproteobacteria bacterium]
MYLEYIEPVFRPPSEANSLILQVTNGCSWNNCTFCDMYTEPQKKFRPKSLTDIEQELQLIERSGQQYRRIFLADGDAMSLSFKRLHGIMSLINKYLPDTQRVSSYCLPRNLLNKTEDELLQLQTMGLTLMYVGCETGDDLLLEKVQKGESFDSSLIALTKIKNARMKSSVMILNGLGGTKYSEQHAINSARLMNAAQPDYLATLVVTFYHGEERFQQAFGGNFSALKPAELFNEMEILLQHLELEKTIFRSDHASNYLILKGILGRDKDQLLKQVQHAIHNQNSTNLRQEWQRGF